MHAPENAKANPDSEVLSNGGSILWCSCALELWLNHMDKALVVEGIRPALNYKIPVQSMLKGIPGAFHKRTCFLQYHNVITTGTPDVIILLVGLELRRPNQNQNIPIGKKCSKALDSGAVRAVFHD